MKRTQCVRPDWDKSYIWRPFRKLYCYPSILGIIIGSNLRLLDLLKFNCMTVPKWHMLNRDCTSAFKFWPFEGARHVQPNSLSRCWIIPAASCSSQSAAVVTENTACTQRTVLLYCGVRWVHVLNAFWHDIFNYNGFIERKPAQNSRSICISLRYYKVPHRFPERAQISIIKEI